MDKQYVALPDPTWERMNSGWGGGGGGGGGVVLFRSVTSSMPGKSNFISTY